MNAMYSYSSLNNGKTELTTDMLRRFAPSIFAERPYHKVSEHYVFIPTAKVLERLTSEGWKVVHAKEQRVRLEDKKGFTKHRLMLQHRDAMPLKEVGDTMPRIMLTNSHDRASAYVIEAGLFRLACSNGLVVSSGNFGRVSIRHSGQDIAERVLEGTFSVVGDMAEIGAEVGNMRALTLDGREQLAFAEAAIGLRWDGAAPVTAEQLLTVRRMDDRSNDLWTTYNRVQENIVRGGLHGVNAAGRHARTRGVNSINEDTRINRALWQLAQSMAQLKKAA